MAKTYNTPMLQVVSMKHNDIVTASDPVLSGIFQEGDVVLSADRYRDWDAGY